MGIAHNIQPVVNEMTVSGEFWRNKIDYIGTAVSLFINNTGNVPIGVRLNNADAFTLRAGDGVYFANGDLTISKVRFFTTANGSSASPTGSVLVIAGVVQ